MKGPAQDSSSLQSAFDEAIAELPQTLFAGLLKRKLEAAGVKAKPALVRRLTEHAFAGGADGVEWPGLPANVVIEFTQEDFDELDRAVDDLTQNELPRIVHDAVSKGGVLTYKGLKRNWPAQYAWEQEQHSGFRERLEQRWGKALRALRMLVTISRDIGGEFRAKLAAATAHHDRLRNGVLLRLHARATQVTDEIVVLLENGYADGALARWRTLHEIEVVATLIAEHGDPLAERYVAHEVIEEAKMTELAKETAEELGYKPPSKRDLERASTNVVAAVEKYGVGFDRDYGWAIGQVTPSNSFKDLAKAAKRSRLRAHYKLASNNVHAGVRGISHRLGSMGTQTLLAGASNAGLDEAGQNAAISLAVINQLLVVDTRRPTEFVGTLDDTLQLKVLSEMMDDAIRCFVRAGRKLAREEAEIARAKHATEKR